jgi:hypothetical protein
MGLNWTAPSILEARTPPSMIRTEVFWLVEPRGFEPLTSCLQIMLILPCTGADLREHVSGSDRCYPLITLANCTLIAQRRSRWLQPVRRGPYVRRDVVTTLIARKPAHQLERQLPRVHGVQQHGYLVLSGSDTEAQPLAIE